MNQFYFQQTSILNYLETNTLLDNNNKSVIVDGVVIIVEYTTYPIVKVEKH